MKEVKIYITSEKHLIYAAEICSMIEKAAKIRGTGIAKRDPKYIQDKMKEGKAVIALDGEKTVGFCYVETWQHGKYVANSGLIIDTNYRGLGLAKKIKKKAFELSRKLFPGSKLFGLTTSLPVMKINSDLGYRPVTFSELTQDDAFWKGCQGCINYDILNRTERKHCLCTGMLYESQKPAAKEKSKKKSFKIYERWLKYKRNVLFKQFKFVRK